MKLFIKARPERGFWRCGIFHPHAGHEVDAFDLPQSDVDRLMTDPQLIVSVVPEEGGGSNASADQGGQDELVRAAIMALPSSAFDAKGRPDLKAIKATVPGATAAIRDRVWGEMTGPNGPRIQLSVSVDERVAKVLGEPVVPGGEATDPQGTQSEPTAA